MNLIEKIKHLAAEKLIVREWTTAEVAAHRMAICEGCPNRNKEENKCTVCGCFLDLKTEALTNWNAKKVRNEVTHCPLGKWGDVEIANEYRRIDGKELITA